MKALGASLSSITIHSSPNPGARCDANARYASGKNISRFQVGVTTLTQGALA